MTVLVACETLLLVLLVLLVAGLLRSHAEILRRLGPPEDDSPDGDRRLPSPERRAGGGGRSPARLLGDRPRPPKPVSVGPAIRRGFAVTALIGVACGAGLIAAIRSAWSP